MEDLLIMPAAVALDLILGEMPCGLHPVVGMGKLLSFGLRFSPQRGRVVQFLYGAALVLLVATVFGGAVFYLLSFTRALSPAVYVLVGAVLFKASFSVRELAQSARRVKKSLLRNDMDGARSMLRSLVSRETADLDPQNIVGATVESVAENTSDSFVAPLFYFLLFGVPGAIVYRVVNSADAMIGYHGKFEYIGKFAARLDDLLNLIPARLTGLLLVVASYLGKADGKRSWRVMQRDHGLTESPNAGWPMSAMAGSLNVQLQKAGLYRLGDAGEALTPGSIDASIKIMAIAALLSFVAASVVKGVQVALAS